MRRLKSGERYDIVNQLHLVRRKPDGTQDMILGVTSGAVPDGTYAMPDGKPDGIKFTVIKAPGLAKGKGALI